MENNKQDHIPAITEMTFKDIFLRLKSGKKTIYLSMGIGLIIGILIVLITPKTYSTKVTLLSETQQKSGASNLLGQLGGLSGIDMGSIMGLNIGGSSGSDVLSPDVYPEVIKSTPFLLDVMNQEVTTSKKNKKMPLAEYLIKHTSPSVAGRFFNIFNSNTENNNPFNTEFIPNENVLHLNKTQTDLLKTLEEMIHVSVQKSGDKLLGGRSKILTLSVEAQDPLVSAVLADSVVNTLKEYVINYNTGKAKKDLAFIKKQYNIAKRKYYQAQKKLADFNDSHNNVILATVNSQRERLRKDYTLATTLYTSLARMLEKSKIEVQERTPVFTIIEPAKVPLKKSAPKTTLILLGFIIIGAFVGFSIELVKIFINIESKTEK